MPIRNLKDIVTVGCIIKQKIDLRDDRVMADLTRRALAESVTELLNEKPLDKIKIKDITDRCGVTRNTFYYHFQDIYDLLSWIFETQADELLNQYQESKEWEDFILSMFDYLQEHRRMVYHVYKSISFEELANYLRRTVDGYVFKIIEIQTRGMDIDKEVINVVADFYRYAVTGETLQWISDGMKTPTAELALSFDCMFKGTLAAAIESAESFIKRK